MAYHFYLFGGWPDRDMGILNFERIGVLHRPESIHDRPQVLYYETASGLSFVQVGLFDTHQCDLVNEHTVRKVLDDDTMIARWSRALPRLEVRRKHLMSLALDKGMGAISRSAARRECNRLYWIAAAELDPAQFRHPDDELFGAQA